MARPKKNVEKNVNLNVENAPETNKEFYTPLQVSKLLNVDKQTVLRYIKKGLMIAQKNKTGLVFTYAISVENFEKFKEEYFS